MSPKKADPDSRAALIATAGRLIAQGRSLTARTLSTELGTSTMAVYTHFRGMEPLREAVRRDGFARLRDRLGAITPTGDPVADVSVHGSAYLRIGIANPELYRAMFLQAPVDPVEEVVRSATLEPVAAAVGRCVRAGRFAEASPEALAVQLWIATHGAVTLAIADAFPRNRLLDYLARTATNLYIGFGDSRDAAERSVRRATKRIDALDLEHSLV